MIKTGLLGIFIITLCTSFKPLPEELSGYFIAKKMFDRADDIQSLTYTITKQERVKGKLTKQVSFTKMQKNPYKVYLRQSFPNDGMEVLYVQGDNNGKALINPNGFPWLNLKLDPMDGIMRNDQHHTIFQSGFDHVISILEFLCEKYENEIDEIERIVNQVFPDELEANLFEMRCKKLGIQNWNESIASNIWNPLMRLFQSSQIDYTIFWRLLYYSCSNDRREVSFESIRDAFYEEPSSIEDWNEWLSIWSKEIDSESVKKMRTANPKYVPREWMLVKAYEDAETGDYEEIEVLQRLFGFV